MLKYRALTTAELQELETEFKQFLIVNNLHDAEWRVLANEDPQKAQEFIDLFSNIVLEKVYSSVAGLLQIGRDYLTVFDFQHENWQLYHFEKESKQDFKEIDATNWLAFLWNSWPQLQLKKGTKKSSPHKAQEVYTLLSKGAHAIHKDELQDFMKLLNGI